MAYVNVAEWSPDQVSEWLKGLDDVILPYIHYFVNNQVDGKRLLQLSHDELPSLHVTKIGHQEIILQGVELLRNIHYHLHQENVQYLALRLSSKARSIYNELRALSASSRGGGGSAGEEEDGEEEEDGTGGDHASDKKKQERVSTAVIAGVADVLSSVKGVVSWLNRQPFEGVEQYDSLKSDLVELSIRLATIAQRDMFAENQATVILQSCLKLANISDKIIQECNDPLIIQPASLDIATIKKKADDEWGVMLQSSYHGVHQVSGVRALSPAHQCGKLQEGDELVQVSYQTVVGWAPHKVAAIMQECPVEVILTVKKRPCHSNTVTQIYFKPFRLPSKKRTYSPWATSVMNSPRDDLQSIPNLQLPASVGKSLQRTESKESRPRSLTPPPAQHTPPPRPLSSLSNDARNTTSDSEAEDSDLEDDPFFSDSDVGGSSPISARLYHPKPRAPVQRRATIPGATTRPSFSFDKLLQDVRWQRGGRSPDGTIPSDPDLRATAGVEQRAARPHTCIGTEKKDRVTGGGDVAAVKEEGTEGDGQAAGSSKNGTLETLSCSETREGSSQEQLTDAAEEKRVVNVIPLPPRKPTGQGITPTVLEPHSQHDHSGDGKVVGGKEAAAGTSVSPGQKCKPASLSSQLKVPDKTLKAGQELKLDISTRQRRVSEDRPKLDKSHSTPAYDMEEENTLQGVASPALTPLEKSPANQTSSPRFFNADSKSAFAVSGGDTPPRVSREGHSKGQSSQASRGSKPKPATIISSATTNIGEGSTQHFKSQVIFPMSAASHGTAPSTIHGVGRPEGSRRISCRELGQGDHQGWLLRRRDNKGFLLPHRWERRWFILKKNYLYGYRDREAVRADSLIYLPGFHVCPAPDVKSKKLAFKIYHSSGATFYFACETSEERSRWMSQMGLSAISSGSQGRHQHHTHQQNVGDDLYYSETDEEMEERASPSRRSPQSPQSRISPTKELGSSLWRGGSASPARGPNVRTQPLSSITSTLGSAKGQGLKFLQSSRDTLNQPVPTASYRSYRRVSESGNRSTSTGDLRGGARTELGTPQADTVSTADASTARRVTRKNSLRDRLRQLPASLTLERRRQVTSRNGQPTQQQQQQQLQQQQQQLQQQQLQQQQQQQQKQQQQSQHQQPKPKILPKHKDSREEVDYEVMHPPEGVLKKPSIPMGQEAAQDVYVSIVEQRVQDVNAASTEVAHRQYPHYMLPTRASSHQTPARPSSVDLDTRASPSRSPSRSGNGRWSGTPPPSGRSSPSKLDLSGRRGSVGGESPLRPKSPRRGSLDCLASSRPRALSPPISPLHTPTRSSHGSTSSLLASEEYREGSPEKLWINSLRSDHSRQKPGCRVSPEKREGRARSGSGEASASDRLKQTALYHPLQMRNRVDPMKATFELSLDPHTSKIYTSNSTNLIESSPTSGKPHFLGEEARLTVVSPKRQLREPPRMQSTPRPEVPPRTKFLSPSERTLPSGTTLSTSASTLPPPSSSGLSASSSTRSTSSLPSYPSPQVMASPERLNLGHSIGQGLGHGASQTRTSKQVPNLTIRTHSEENDALRTPLKPAMGVSMIGKQRRTPGILSPRDVFFSSPPSSPTTPFSPSIPPLMCASPSTSIGTQAIPITAHQYSSLAKAKTGKLRQQKILPHYPGMEYPPVFEPGSYSLCGSPPEPPIYQVPVTPTSVVPEHQAVNVNVAGGAYLQEMESSDGSEGSHTLLTESREAKAQLNIYVPGFASSGNESSSHPNLAMSSTSGTRSHQNVYVSSPSVLRSHQNLYVTSPSGSVSHQNVYVSAPSRSSVQQGSEVIVPHRPATIGFSGPGCSSYQNVFVTSVSGSGVNKERQKSVSSVNVAEEGEASVVLRVAKSPSRPQGPPRLLLPGPPETPPSDCEADLTTSSTQTEA
ncbi:uncharacterized protein LOC122257059 isoform X3 [Penaeus japonicus]|uniref:uncharacterized protein LOC122257059 isoform X3 n=1 Tax=Penaeus japonicus TaxID=27405 RepID=UPI001C71684E|nr:uncharacterized protein LOC122257059 isoform X3 [Penaeus japonicus]